MIATATEPLVDIRQLSVAFGDNLAVDRVDLEIGRGETVALVGESGSGKSVTALSILRLLPYPLARHPGGAIRFEGRDLLSASPEQMREMRGNRIGMIFQEPMTSLNPLHRVLRQISETLVLHKHLSDEAARERTLELLEMVGIQNAASRLESFPHELSGGQRQRVMIAMALANEPDLLIADEPTTALDVTIQAQILKLLAELQRQRAMSLLLISHDLGIVRKMAKRVVVMQGGRVVEQGPVAEVFDNPQHEYTRHLVTAEPRPKTEFVAEDAPALITGRNVRVWFPIKRGVFRRVVGHIKAVDGVDIDARQGETIGIVGESGSGKTTLAMALLRLVEMTGEVAFRDQRIEALSRGEMRPLRRVMQVVFQDPYGSLSPRLSVGEIVAEGLEVHDPGGAEEAREHAVVEALQEVGLDPETRHRYPHEFSGGQRQRIAIARALILKPSLIVLDEPTSALDMSVQTQIVDLLRALQHRHKLTFLFISHDLRVIRAMSDRVIVMRDGKVVEQGSARNIFEAPRTDYTRALLAAALHHEVAHPEAIRQ